MACDLETVEALVRIMEKHGLRRIQAGDVILERGEVVASPPPRDENEERTPRRRPADPGLGHYADEDLWPEGEYPEELLSNMTAETTMR